MRPVLSTPLILVSVLLLSSIPVFGQHVVTLTAREDLQNRNTYRVIERKGTSYTDVTQDGFRIGTITDGDRIAVFRPNFRDDIRPFWQWTVQDVTWSLANASNSTMEMANLGWGFQPDREHHLD